MSTSMTSTLLAAFLLAGATSSFSPGPNNLMVMTSSAKFGLGPTVPHCIGITLGFPLMVFIVGLGLGELFVAYPAISTVMRYGAAAYFLWMAYHMLGITIGPATGRERPMRTYEAALFQWINPKAWAMAVSFVALFVPPGPDRIANLALGCGVFGALSSSTWMIFGRGLTVFLARTGLEKHLGVILAGLMLCAVVLFLI
tara:strand:- start:9379 stop:9975 length:597 start_codon:yes stop_codon:yes gene_type:complete